MWESILSVFKLSFPAEPQWFGPIAANQWRTRLAAVDMVFFESACRVSKVAHPLRALNGYLRTQILRSSGTMAV